MESSQFPVLSFRKNQNLLLLRWLKFNAVGAIGMVVQLTALALLRSWLNLDYLLATGVAVEITVMHNFLWHERFTWADRQPGRPIQSLFRFAKFNASNGAVSIVGNLAMMWLLVVQVKLNYVASNVCGIAACSVANFLLGDRFVFEKKDRRPAAIS